MIHPTAIVDSKAEIDSDVEIGAYSIISGSVQIGKGCVIGPHVTVEPFVSISRDCHIFQYASIGAKPQDLKFKGEKSYLKIGRGTVIREFATINRGTGAGGGITEVGEDNFLMDIFRANRLCRARFFWRRWPRQAMCLLLHLHS